MTEAVALTAIGSDGRIGEQMQKGQKENEFYTKRVYKKRMLTCPGRSDNILKTSTIPDGLLKS